MMASVMIAIHATEQQLRLHVIIQCFNQQMHHTKQLLEHRAQENGVSPQDVQSSELALPLKCYDSNSSLRHCLYSGAIQLSHIPRHSVSVSNTIYLSFHN